MERQLRKLLMFPCLLALMSNVGCGKKCTGPLGPYESITGVEWRLIETSNPSVLPVPISAPSSYKTLDRFTFEIWSFASDGGGTVTQVEHNDKHEQPFLNFTYSLVTGDGKSGTFNATFTPPPPANSGSGSTPPPAPTQKWNVSYSYQLKNDLRITDNQGHTYHFVEYKGIIPPDSTCTF